MVGTRKHPEGDFPETPTPPTSTTNSFRTPSTTSQTLTRRSKSVSRRSNASSSVWTHTPSNLTLLWLTISVPLVIWDTGYVLLRPHSMPGGKLHAPIWKPYALYGAVDYIYGWPAWDGRNGFTAAQSSVNLLETIGYAIYLALVYTRGVEVKTQGRGAPKKLSGSRKVAERMKRLARAREVSGKEAAWCTLLGFAVATVTLSKTVLYWLNEVFSGFDNIGHNPPGRLVLTWIVPNGLWLIFPTYMIYVFGREILEGLEASTGPSKKQK